jgi:L-threonylcarbamoyladenylate synthase
MFMDIKFEKAVEVFKNGGVVIFSTDTAIGIGCRIDDEKAVERLFRIRKRPENKPLLVLVSSIKMAQKYLLPIPEKVKNEMIEPYWPGRLTIILECDTKKVPSLVRSRGDALGIRLPDNLRLQELINRVGVPLVAPSANFAGEKTPFKFGDLDSKLVEQVDYVLCDEESLGKKESTIIDCSVEPWKIVRNGAVKI